MCLNHPETIPLLLLVCGKIVIHQTGPWCKGMATLSSILAWRIPMDRGAWWAIIQGVAKSQTRLK